MQPMRAEARAIRYCSRPSRRNKAARHLRLVGMHVSSGRSSMVDLPKRQLGRTGLQVTMLGYGAMELRGAPRARDISAPQAETILGAVLDAAKRGVILINTARGPVVDIDALYDAMKDGTVQAAGLDVLPEEPANAQRRLIAASQKNEDWIRHRLLLTPH